MVPANHPDRPASTATTYNADGLPETVTDAEGHTVSVSYNASTQNPANLVVTLTSADNSTRTLTLDAVGRTLEAVDENGVATQGTYNPQGQVKSVRRAVGTANETLATCYYDDRGDLCALDPPKGAAGRIFFHYTRYSTDGTPDPASTCEGQLTHVAYPDGSWEVFTYDEGGELAGTAKSGNGAITLDLHARHRANRPIAWGAPQRLVALM